ncbi:MAG: hypothetical protein J5848_01850 [Bacteroidales bacterium]|nr:hypothetical protein [Bacteroidales bacterium]
MFKNKKTILFFILVTCCCLVACNHDDPTFDPALLIGKWVSGTEYYRYDADGTGATWDTSDDVSEEEAQPYTWQFNEETNRLTVLHQMEMGGVIPKSYTVTNLTENLLQYKDQYNQSFTYNRVR